MNPTIAGATNPTIAVAMTKEEGKIFLQRLVDDALLFKQYMDRARDELVSMLNAQERECANALFRVTDETDGVRPYVSIKCNGISHTIELHDKMRDVERRDLICTEEFDNRLESIHF